MIAANSLQKMLIDVTAGMCGHQERQGELHMTALYLPVQEILANIKNGHVVDLEKKMKFFQGTVADDAFKRRMERIFRQRYLFVDPEIKAYGGRLVGHPDAIVDEVVAVEFKTVPTIEILEDMRIRRVLPRKVRCQVQSYLQWGEGLKRGIVVYESREGGFPWCVDVEPDEYLQRELKAKAEEVIRTMWPGTAQ